MKRSHALGLTTMLGFVALCLVGCDRTGTSRVANHEVARGARSCKAAGVRYVGSTDQNGEVCFTLTPDENRLLELGFDSVCPSALVHSRYKGILPKPGARGLIELAVPFYRGQRQIASLRFRGNIRGAAASGVITNQGFCEDKLQWTAHRQPTH
jgi:hypothetical protein